MPTITKLMLGGTNNGSTLIVSSTQGSTQNIHSVAITATTTIDEVWIWAKNSYSQTVDVNLVIGTGSSDSKTFVITPVSARDGLSLICPGIAMAGSAIQVGAFVGGLNGSASPACSGSGLIGFVGYVNRINQA